MLKKVALLILANIIFTTAIIAIYAVGYEHDKAYQLFPESKLVSYDVGMQVYGQRWARLVKFFFIAGVLADAAVLLGWYRNWQSKQKDRLGLDINL
ncbi:MAG: hypothetical protein ACR2IH_03165 [Pyrinomonadaceae bacterium]